ncbi:WD repeat-containing protein 3-like [Lineus longissimus]|uniref:WD repeat-containing protein 3-like n=1 Tax=Lineus longissimus TaxID=88925 RepID=UPI002B4D47DE
MGLTKQYLRYAAGSVFNVVGSQKSNIVYLEVQGVKGKYCAVGACENVIVWDLRTGDRHLFLQGGKHEVTALGKSPDKRSIAVGYNDGTVIVFSLLTGDAQVTFHGHKSCLTALQFDHTGVRLVSGSKDTDIIIWDVINESGLYRLKGHKDQITQARFMRGRDILVTSSKDTFIKFWDLETQHCFKTLVGQRTEVWDFILSCDNSRLITGSGDNEIRVWSISYGPEAGDAEDPASKRMRLEAGEEEEEETDILSCKKIGSVIRRGKNRVVSMTTDASGTLLGLHGNDTVLELLKVETEVQVQRRIQKRQKKARKRMRDSGAPEEVTVSRTVDDELLRLCETRIKGKIRSFDILKDGNHAKIVVLLTCNTIEQFSVDLSEKKPQCESLGSLTMPGHKTDVRTVAFSSDNTAFLSASGEAVKIWNRSSQHCIRTMACSYALSSLFAPGDRHVVVGTKDGKLQILDIASGMLSEEIVAHSGAIWTMCMSPDKRGIVTGSADQEVKFWDFELVAESEYSSRKRLTLVHSRTLKMSDDVLCVRFSPDQRLLAISLLDNTVKVFFSDTLKFFLSLYGHKLPVLCMDISSDSQLLVTGSADRNVKLWGLDFGDCHKSMFAHDDSIMCVQFVAKTHLFFTCGKDKKLKQWDGDKFEHILTLEGHHAEIWCLAVSPSGNFVLTGSHDRSLRIWEKTTEPLILDEEKEIQREKEHDDAIGDGEQPVVPGEANTEVGIAGKKTVETVKAAERIMEALELYKEEEAKLEQHEAECKAKGKELPPPPLHMMLVAFRASTPKEYVMNVLKRVKSSELEESLLVLPFSYVIDLLALLDDFLASHWETELCCRCLFFLLRIHHGQITSNQTLMPVLERLQSQTSNRVHEIRERIGFNMAGLHFLKKQVEAKEEVMLFADATGNFKAKKKKEKKKALLTIKT